MIAQDTHLYEIRRYLEEHDSADAISLAIYTLENLLQDYYEQGEKDLLREALETYVDIRNTITDPDLKPEHFIGMKFGVQTLDKYVHYLLQRLEAATSLRNQRRITLTLKQLKEYRKATANMPVPFQSTTQAAGFDRYPMRPIKLKRR